MALNVFELFGKIALDTSGAKSGLDDTVGHAKKTESSLSKTFKKIGGMVAAAFSVGAIVDFGKQCTAAYASIAAEESAFAQIMGDYAGTAQEKLLAVSDATGVASTRLTSSMTSMTAKFKGLGYDVEDATTLAADGLLIASDAAAFWDMSLDESMSHLNSFINGSYEGGEAIGLFANDTQMAAYAIEQGLVADAKAWAALDEATKQATRLDYAKNMMEQSGATGQAAKESQSYANVMANLKESWRQFQGVVGKPILEKFVLPAMQKLNEFMPKLTESVQNGIVWLEEGFDKIASYFTDVFTEDGLNLDALPKALTNMFRDLGRSVGGLLSNFGQTIRNGWNNTVWPMIQRTFKAVFGIELPDWATVKQSISDGWTGIVWPAIQGFFTEKFGITLPSWEDLKNSITTGWKETVWPAIQGFFTNPLEIVLPAWENLKNNISTGWKETVWPAIQNFFTTPFDITLPSWDTLKTNISDGWNNTVWPAIQGFFSKAFDIGLPSWETLVSNIKTGWNDTVWPGIKDFFKTALEIALPVWEDLKTSISTGWEETVWPAIKGFFVTAYEIVLPVWEDLKTSIVNGWNNTVVPALAGLFEAVFEVNPEDATGIEVGKKLREWWDKVVATVGDIFKAIFSVMPEDTNGETTGQRILDWWNSVVAFIGNIFRGFFGVDPDDPQSTANKIINWFETVLKSVGNIFSATFKLVTSLFADDGVSWADKIKEWWDSVISSVGDIFGSIFEIRLPSASAVINSIKSWWNGIVSNISLSLSAFWSGITGGEEDGGTSGSTKSKGSYGQAFAGSSGIPQDTAFTFLEDGIPGFATGLDYVPRDNFLARLHEGEAVLNRNEADAWRNGNSTGNTGRVETVLVQMADLLRDIAQNTGAEKQVVLETGALVGQLAPGIDAQLGLISNRKGRRN